MTREEKLLQISSHTETEIKGFCGDYFFLSNMYPCNINWLNKNFKSVESAYQASKFFENDIIEQFTNITGYEAKALAKKYKKYIRPDWEIVKVNIKRQLIFQKFLLHDDLQSKLCNTLDRYLEETNYWGDTFFGVYNGVGENILGKILMDTRNYFMYSL